MLEGSVPGFFRVSREAASGQLPAFEMVADAFTANALACTGIIAAVAGRKVFFLSTLHIRFLSKQKFGFQKCRITFVYIRKFRVDQKSFME
jgi:hypothetical protein